MPSAEMSTPAPKPPRFGVLLSSFQQPAWVRSALTELLEKRLVTLDLAVAVAGHGRVTGRQGRPLVLRLYLHLDDRLYRDACRPDALGLGDIRPLLAGSQMVNVEWPAGMPCPDDMRAATEQADLDVLWNLTDFEVPEAVRRAPRRGVWRVDAHAIDAARSVLSAHHSCEARLRRLGTAANEDVVLDRSWTSIDRYSTRHTLNRLSWRASALVARAISSEGRATTWPETQESADALLGEPQLTGNLQTALGITNLAWRYAVDKRNDRRFQEQWALAVWVHEPREAPRFTGPPTFHVEPPTDRFWADPFPFEHQGRCYVFVEELLFSEPKGFISVIEIDERGLVGSAQPVIREPHHLSYPSVFRRGAEIFMTPESSEARRIDLYRAVSFPDRWEKVAVLMEDVAAADPTIFEFDGLWWMFASLRPTGGPNWDECHLFVADRLEGPWRPHPQNPIRSDVRRARPAGRVFHQDGHLYRPAQDCSVRYGYATVIHEVDELTPDSYSEHQVARFEPNWRPDGQATHTLNHSGRFTVVDCLLRRARGSDGRSS
jgi:hypothetical protein